MPRWFYLFRSPGSVSFLPLTLMRVAFGLFFFAAGFNKLFVTYNKALMLETMIEAGIPFPSVMAIVVAAFETVFGLLLAVGLLTRISALVLMIISLTALFTVGLHHIPGELNLLTWYSWLLYLPESSYILMSILLVIQGCGPLGLDRLIVRRAANTTRSNAEPNHLPFPDR